MKRLNFASSTPALVALFAAQSVSAQTLDGGAIVSGDAAIAANDAATPLVTAEAGASSAEPISPPQPQQPQQPQQQVAPVLQGDLADASEFGVVDEPPPAETHTGLSGRVIDQSTRQPIIDALVVAVGTRHRTRTNPAGNFAFDLPPGRYTIRVVYPGYRTIRYDRIQVRQGENTQLNVDLPLNARAPLIEARTTGRADRNTAATQIAIRRNSASVQDSVSAQEIARAPDAAASDAVRRVVGVSIADGRYAVVRGLGGRYVNAMLNGVPLPPTDPDVPGVQLDLFPASLLTSLSVVKSFMPELPGDWAGGSLQIATRDFPERFTMQASGSLGFDTLTHLDQSFANGGLGALRYDGGALDFLGIDDGTRSLPAGVPRRPLVAGLDGITRDQVVAAGRLLPARWGIFNDVAYPNGSLSFQLGNTSRIAGRPFGYLLALTYGATTRARLGAVARTRLEGEGAMARVVERERAMYRGTQLDIQWGALATLSYSPAPDNDLSFVGLFNQAATDEAAFRTGFSEDAGSDQTTRVQRAVHRTLFFAQLSGDHRGSSTRSGRFRWSGFMSASERGEPDTRFFKYSLDDPSRPRAAFGTGGIDRIYTGLSQLEGGASLDVTAPAGPLVLRAGALSRFTGRDFSARRFTYEESPGNNDPDLAFRLPDAILSRDNIGSAVELREYTQPNDSYRGSAQYLAPYARIDGKLFNDRLRFATGARVEYYRQFVLSASPFATEQTITCRTERSESGALPNCTDRTDVNVLPALGLVVELNPAMSLRANYGATVGRPLFRELAPFLFPDVVRNRLITGNPQLRTANIHNVDLRWEYFLGGSELFAVSAFAKSFADPIEAVNNAQGSSASLTYCNARDAVVVGGELEARVSMARVHRSLSALSVAANLSLSWSEVNIPADSCGGSTFLLTNTRRPLGGQSPVVANVVVGFAPTSLPIAAYAFYNVYASRLEEAGSFGLPDVYQDTFHQLDFAFNWTPSERFNLRFTAKNVLGQPVLLRQGNIVVEERLAGAAFALRAQLNY